MAAPTLRRGIFGYSRKSVREVVADRDVELIRASKDARASQERIAALEPALENARREVAESEARNRDLASQLKDSAERFRAVERSGSPSTTEGLTDVLHAAERALARLTDAARRNAEHELGETERARGELRAEIERLAAWRDRMMPLSGDVRHSIEDAQAATGTLAQLLAELAETSPVPLAEPMPDRGAVIRLDEAEAPREDRADAREDPSDVWIPDGPRRFNTG